MIKMKMTRICARKGCNKEFKLRTSLDKYCSPSCAYSSQKAKPKKKQKAIKPMSEKRKQESFAYKKKRATFMSRPENKYCPVCKAAYEGKIDLNEISYSWLINKHKGIIETKEVHHKAGRIGKLLLYVPYWLAVSSIGHKWIHAHPEKAYELGFLIRSTSVKI